MLGSLTELSWVRIYYVYLVVMESKTFDFLYFLWLAKSGAELVVAFIMILIFGLT